MKHFILHQAKFVASLLLIIAVAAASGCKKDSTPDREKFLGAYSVNENCTSGNYSFSITIIESATVEDGIVINNFGDYGVNVLATVAGDNININDTKSGIQFTGTGSISGNTLTIIYTASQSGTTDNCTATCIRQ